MFFLLLYARLAAVNITVIVAKVTFPRFIDLHSAVTLDIFLEDITDTERNLLARRMLA
jgi:hypothetical protein